MSIDCQWIEKNLEALFCDELNAEESRLARTHIEGCTPCRKELAALNAIDPLVKKYFQEQMSLAVAPRRTRMSAVYGAAAVAVAATLLIVVTLRTPETNTVSPTSPSVSTSAGTATVAEPPVIKDETEAGTARAKPEPAVAPDTVRTAPVVAPDQNAPDFLVTDPAGYSSTLNDYRGYVALIGLWSSDRPESAANLERLYKNFSANTKLRFVGVTNERQARAANTTFPVVYNQGSKVLGLQPGEFVLLDESGTVELRGSLVKDFDNLRQVLQGK